MGIRQFKPVTSATRFRSVSDFAEVTKPEPERALLEPLKKTGGRNNKGHITARWRGGAQRGGEDRAGRAVVPRRGAGGAGRGQGGELRPPAAALDRDAHGARRVPRHGRRGRERGARAAVDREGGQEPLARPHAAGARRGDESGGPPAGRRRGEELGRPPAHQSMGQAGGPQDATQEETVHQTHRARTQAREGDAVMARSVKKGPYVEPSLLVKITALNEKNEKKVFKTWSRRSTITPDFVGHTLAVHNGNKFIPVYITANMVANAQQAAQRQNAAFDADLLRVKYAVVNEGPTLKRFTSAAMGRATPILKRTSHVEIHVEAATSAPKPAAAPAPPPAPEAKPGPKAKAKAKAKEPAKVAAKGGTKRAKKAAKAGATRRKEGK